MDSITSVSTLGKRTVAASNNQDFSYFISPENSNLCSDFPSPICMYTLEEPRICPAFSIVIFTSGAISVLSPQFTSTTCLMHS